MTAHAILRAETAVHHYAVDAAFRKFDLGKILSYRAFLHAHAKALMPMEALLRAASDIPPWRPRLQLLEQDLFALEARLPEPLVFNPLLGPSLYGILYVLEGSRLGGGTLADKLGVGFPSAYLSAVHQQGEWRLLLATIDACALALPPLWMEDALSGAHQAFELFERAATETGPLP